MNKSLLLLAGLVTCNAVALMRPSSQQDSIRVQPTPGIVEEYYGPTKKEKTAQDAFNRVEPKLRKYKTMASAGEIDNFVNYLNYYKSWYQSVTPAPISITSKLTDNDRSVEKYIKYEAQDFVTQPDQTGEKPRMGASTLSRAGEDYYLMIINYFTPSTRSKKPMPLPTKPRQQIKPAQPFQRVL